MLLHILQMFYGIFTKLPRNSAIMTALVGVYFVVCATFENHDFEPRVNHPGEQKDLPNWVSASWELLRTFLHSDGPADLRNARPCVLDHHGHAREAHLSLYANAFAAAGTAAAADSRASGHWELPPLASNHA